MSKNHNPQEIVESVVAGQLKHQDDLPLMSPGDTIDVHYRIIEGEKERIQIFQGVLLSMNSRGINRTITVRRIVANEGVERIFPLHSPRIAKIEVVRRGDARRSGRATCTSAAAPRAPTTCTKRSSRCGKFAEMKPRSARVDRWLCERTGDGGVRLDLPPRGILARGAG